MLKAAEECREAQRRDEELSILKMRAEAGDADAQYRLGAHFLPRAYGISWLCRAADRGHAEARQSGECEASIDRDRTGR